MEQRFIIKAVSPDGIDAEELERALSGAVEAADIDASVLTREPMGITLARSVIRDHKRTIAAIEHELIPYDLIIRNGPMKGTNIPLSMRAGIAAAILGRILSEGEFIAAPKAPFEL